MQAHATMNALVWLLFIYLFDRLHDYPALRVCVGGEIRKGSTIRRGFGWLDAGWACE